MLPGLLPIASRRVLACRDTLAAGLAARPAGLHPILPEEAVGPAPLPAGVDGNALASIAAVVAPLRVTALDGLHDDALARAWADGAWDIQIDLMPPLAGNELLFVTAGLDYDLDPGLRDILVEAAGRGRLATWIWRPMRYGAAVRVAAHATRDLSLGPDQGREGPPPAVLKRPDFGRRRSWSWTIRLGQAARSPPRPKRPPYSPPATRKQRACIAALQYAAGATRPDIPARLTMREASAMIDRIKGESRA